MRQTNTQDRLLQIVNLKSAIANLPWHRLSVLAFLLFGLAVASAAVADQAESPQIVGVRVGWDGCYKVGRWTSVDVTLRGGGEPLAGDIVLTVPDGDGVPTRVSTPPETPCELTPGQETTVRLTARFGRVEGDLTVEFRAKNGASARRTFTTASVTDADHFLSGIEFRKLVAVVGADSVGAEELSKSSRTEKEFHPVVAQLSELEALPLQWNAYEGLDAMILSTSRPEVFTGLTADSPRLQAMEWWIRAGGRLVICVGERAPEVLAESSPLAGLVPGQFEKMESLRLTGAFEGYCGSSTAMPRPEPGQAALSVPRLKNLQGVVEAREADLPLVIRSAHGVGQVIFVGADLDRPPFSRWSSRPAFIAKLLDLPMAGSNESGESAAIMHHGYTDMAGQLRSALDAFTGVHLASFSLVAGLIILYILLVAPGDYFFLRKVVRRMTWTWLTFSLIVIVVSAGAVWLWDCQKGNRLRVNQLDLVDVDAASQSVRGTTWANIFSPRLQTLDLSLQPKLPNGKTPSNAQVAISWFGLCGGGLGGMNPRAGGLAPWNQPYDFSPDLDAMRGVPIQMGATKSVTARWLAATDAFPRVDLTDDGGFISGTVTNTLDFPLGQCLLAYGKSVYELGPIAPHGAVRVDSMTKRSELRTLLTGFKVVAEDSPAGKVSKFRQEQTPYDQSSTDLAYVLRMMMFYDEAGGCRYAGLSYEYQSVVDFSNLLKAARAILIAQGPVGAAESRHGAELIGNGQATGTFDEKHMNSDDKHLTVYRFVYPVSKRSQKRADAGTPRAESLAAAQSGDSAAHRP